MIPSTAKHLMERLVEYADAKVGLPIESHRGKAGRALVVAKKAFRQGFQPFINELLRKQTFFNEAATETFKSVYRELTSLEGAVIAFRTSQDARLKKLEEAVAGLQERAPQSPEARKTLEVVKSDVTTTSGR